MNKREKKEKEKSGILEKCKQTPEKHQKNEPTTSKAH